MDKLKNEIELIRKVRLNDKFTKQEEIDAYYRSSILIFNNLESPYWKNATGDNDQYDDYFSEKMDFKFNSDKTIAINQLMNLWKENKVNTIEFNLRGLLQAVSNSSIIFSDSLQQEIIDTLRPLKKQS